jgi:DNA-directed RNA polymerase specialized sigma24 family protein
VPPGLSGLSPEQIQHAVLMYAKGQSLVTIGKLLGVNAETVHTRLREKGVQIRDTHGRETRPH